MENASRGRFDPRTLEGRLSCWVRHRRSEYCRGVLSLERIELLERVPGWWWIANKTVYAYYDCDWRAQYEQLRQHLEEHHTLPERPSKLGNWVHALVRNNVYAPLRQYEMPGRREWFARLPHWKTPE